MVRWIAVLVLLTLAGGVAWLALSSRGDRGVRMRVYDNGRLEGTPVTDTVMRHIDFGPESSVNPVVVPQGHTVLIDAWLFAPRGGEYEFALVSSGTAILRLGDKTVLRHSPRRDETKDKLHLKKGIYRLQVEVRQRSGHPELAVKWRLPSGYMNLESLPPIYLHPEAPRRGARVPLSLRLGPFVLFGLALLVALWPWLVPGGRLSVAVRRLRTDPRVRRTILCGALVVTCTVGYRLWDVNGAGETSDEWAYAGAGRIYVSNLAHGYFESQYWNANEEHPPVGKYIYGVVSHVAGTDSYTPLRVAAAVMSGLTVLITFLFGVRFLTLFAATTGGLVLAFLPPFVAHGKVAALDAPSALLFTWAAYLFVRALYTRTRRNAWLIAAGIVGSLAFGTKFSSVLIFAFMMGAHLLVQWREVVRRRSVELPLVLFLYPVMPLAILFLIWPWLWSSPFGQLMATLTHWNYPIREWFFGRYIQPPPWYFPVYLVATTPSLLLIPLGAFGYRLFRERRMLHGLVALWAVTPLIWTVSALKQDGIRYIYTTYPPLALMLGLGLERLLPGLRRRVVGAAVTVGYVAVCAVMVHPYYLDYYSEVVGGPRGVYEKSRFEVGWWGEGLDKGIAWVNENAAPGSTWDCTGVVTHTCDTLRADLSYSGRNADYVLRGYITPGDEGRKGYDEVFRVSVRDAPIVIVYRRKGVEGRE